MVSYFMKSAKRCGCFLRKSVAYSDILPFLCIVGMAVDIVPVLSLAGTTTQKFNINVKEPSA
jgi:hypothetical protein